jgi:general L-amino acid transport system permease protein
MAGSELSAGTAGLSVLSDPRFRSKAYQAMFVGAVVLLGAVATAEATAKMQARGIPLGFDFWNEVAGFEINQALIPYSSLSTYGQAFFVGVVNTLVVVLFGVVLATVLGFTIGIMRLSPNWIVRKFSTAYVELVRNVPLLIQLLFWYNAVLKPLPGPKNSIALPLGVYLNNRGIVVPEFSAGPSAVVVFGALAAGVVATIGLAWWARYRFRKTGAAFPMLAAACLLLLGLPGILWLVFGSPFSVTPATLSGFNFKGGHRVYPEFAALLVGLSVYTASYIAEIVRAGIVSVGRGQTDAAQALGLTAGQTLRFVVVPQALRVIVPPLTSQYLNLAKNSTLAVFIGYPDLVQVFAGSVLNQTGAAVQVMAITLSAYLLLSLAMSLLMNLFNQRYAIVER